MEILNRIAFAIGIAGASVIVWGVFLSIIKLLSLEAKRIKKKNICEERNLLRHHLGSYLLLGLEFLIAADIVRSIIRPSLNELAVLGAIVVIRTIMNYFLNKELSEVHDCAVKKSL
jgi:uncharacterized membrane protein